MPIIRNCAPGFVAPVEQLNADCACPPGIVSVTDSANGLDTVYTLSDGTVWSVPKLPGEQGATGATGSAGATGAAGTDGTSLLYNNIFPVGGGATGATTGTNSFETLATAAIPANTMGTNYDMVHVRATFHCGLGGTNPSGGAQECQLLINGLGFGLPIIFNNVDLQVVKFDLWLTRVTNASGQYEMELSAYQNDLLFNVPSPNLPTGATSLQGSYAISSGLDFTTTMNIVAQGKTANSGVQQIQLEQLRVEFYQTGGGGSGGGINSFMPFQTVSSQQSYSPVVGAPGHALKMVYLDGELLPPTGWTYNSATDTITFTQPVNSIMWVQGTYL